MKKRFFNSLLMTALATAVVATSFVSCKDYDDDINDLRNQISGTSTDLTSLVNEKINTVESEISSLQAQAASLQAAYEAADNALQTTLEASIQTAKAAAESYADNQAAAAEAAAEAYADIQAAQAEAAAISAAQTLVNNAVSDLQSQLDAAKAAIEANADSIKALTLADAELTKGIEAAQAQADKAYDLAQTANTLAEENQSNLASLKTTVESNYSELSGLISDLDVAIKAHEQAYEKLNTAVEGLSADVETLKGQVSVLQGQVSGLLEDVNANTADIEAIYKELASLNAADSVALDEVNGRCDDLEKLITANKTAIEKTLTDSVAALRVEILAAQYAAEAYADAAAKTVAEKLYNYLVDNNLTALEAEISDLEDAYKAADEALQKNIDEVQGNLDQATDSLWSKIATLVDKEGLATELESYVKSEDLSGLKAAIEALAKQEDLDDLSDKIEAIEKTLDILQSDESVQDLLEVVNGHTEQIADLWTTIGTLNRYLGEEMKRLKSLVFKPQAYVNGIAAIRLTSLQYTDWGESTNWTADEAPADGDQYTLSDESHIEQYLANPSNFNWHQYDLSFISSTAVNITRADGEEEEDEVPVYVADWTVENGTINVNIGKTGHTSLNIDSDEKDEFYIVALKASLKDEYKNTEYAEENDNIDVYSDWARLYEESITPYIHNINVVDENGNPDCTESEGVYPHFLKYSELYGDEAGVNNGKYADEGGDVENNIAIEHPYTSGFDLNKYVCVCDMNNNSYDLETYGLSFEYHLMEYNVGTDDEAVDQKDFAALEESVITAAPSDEVEGNVTYSRVAIGHTPVVQVVLKDGDHVVDVKYIKIKWTEDAESQTVPGFASFVYDYECGGPTSDYDYTSYYITNGELEEALANLDPSMTLEELQASYTLRTDAYSVDENGQLTKLETGEGGAFGTVSTEFDGNAEDNALTWRIWTNASIWDITQDDYNNGSKTVSAWAVFESIYDEDITIAMEFTLTINITKLEYTGAHIASYWTGADNNTRMVNPQLYSDATYGYSSGAIETTQYIADFVSVYLDTETKLAATEPVALTNGEDAYFIFDATRISALGENWAVSADGYTLYYVDDASLIEEGVITAEDSDIEDGVDDGSIQIAAVINKDDHTIQLYESGIDDDKAGYSDSEPTEAAKQLVDGIVPVALVAEWCEFTDVVEQTSVKFFAPLTFEGSGQTVEVYDLAEGGSSSASIAGTVVIKEIEALGGHLVYSNDPSDEADETSKYAGWYGVSAPVYDLDNATVNISATTGQFTDTYETPLTSIGYKLTEGTDEDGNPCFIFENNSGNTIITEGTVIQVPVHISTKWQEDMLVYIYVKIRPASALPATAKRK